MLRTMTLLAVIIGVFPSKGFGATTSMRVLYPSFAGTWGRVDCEGSRLFLFRKDWMSSWFASVAAAVWSPPCSAAARRSFKRAP